MTKDSVSSQLMIAFTSSTTGISVLETIIKTHRYIFSLYELCTNAIDQVQAFKLFSKLIPFKNVCKVQDIKPITKPIITEKK